MQGQGIIVSKKADQVLSFLEKTGPSPFRAIVIGTGLSSGDTNRVLRILHAAGYSVPQRVQGKEFWIPTEQGGVVGFNPLFQETLAWFVARLEQAGGKYKDNKARYPKGAEMSVVIDGATVRTGNLVAGLEDLKTKALKECLFKI